MTVTIVVGDCRQSLSSMPDDVFQSCITSPPYFGLRDYGHEGQIGLEHSPESYIEAMVSVFREVRRVLKKDGTLWLNIGDSYAGSWGNQGRKEGGGTQRPKTRPSFQRFSTGVVHAVDCDLGVDCRCSAESDAIYPNKQSRTGSWVNDHPTLKPKDLIGIPWRLAFALQADGWYLRSDIIWHKPNPMPESIADRPTKAHEYVFLLSKSARYFYDTAAISEKAVGAGTKNARTVWSINTKPFKGAHFATMPPELARRCIVASSAPGHNVLDPFGGAGTTGLECNRLGRSAVLCELNANYAQIAKTRIEKESPIFSEVNVVNVFGEVAA